MRRLSRWLYRPGRGSAPRATILIRLAVGGEFCASGLIKFLDPNQGAGRFTKLGLPAPEHLANLTGVVEIATGPLSVGMPYPETIDRDRRILSRWGVGEPVEVESIQDSPSVEKCRL